MPLPFDSGGVMVSAAAVSDPPPYDRARAVARYDGTVRALVHGLKFHDRQDVRTLLARWMAMAGTELIPGADLIVPVPLSRQRLLWRRFNQAALLAQELARIERRPFDPFALARVRSTASQVGLTRNERTANVRGAFAVPPAARERVEGRRVLLVDDIITTGATAGAAARALKRAGARAVDVIAVGMVTDEAAVPA
jgi:ComF family protein